MKIGILARNLRKSHRRTRSWRDTGNEFGITGGLAYRIAKENYEPADPGRREKLGLPPRPCPTCHRRVTAPRQIRRWVHLDDLKSDEINYLFNHREEVKL